MGEDPLGDTIEKRGVSEAPRSLFPRLVSNLVSIQSLTESREGHNRNFPVDQFSGFGSNCGGRYTSIRTVSGQIGGAHE